MYPEPAGVTGRAALGLVSALPLTTALKGEGQALLHGGKITRFLLPVRPCDGDFACFRRTRLRSAWEGRGHGTASVAWKHFNVHVYINSRKGLSKSSDPYEPGNILFI